jgi:hypothetical protein
VPWNGGKRTLSFSTLNKDGTRDEKFIEESPSSSSLVMGRLKRRRTLRVGIREQLALLVLLTSLVALAVVSVATWVNNFNFVVGIKSQGLALTASLKAAQVTSFIQLLQTTCNTIVTRVLIQQALQRFYTGNSTDANWVRATSDAQSALASGGYSSLLQIIIYPRNNTGNTYGLLNVTGSGIRPVALPYSYSNGSVSLKNYSSHALRLTQIDCSAG